MQDTAFDPAAIAADAVVLAELHGGSGNECTRIEWLPRRLERAPGRQYVDGVGNLVWTFGPPSYQLAVLVHVDDVFDKAAARASGSATAGCAVPQEILELPPRAARGLI